MFTSRSSTAVTLVALADALRAEANPLPGGPLRCPGGPALTLMLPTRPTKN